MVDETSSLQQLELSQTAFTLTIPIAGEIDCITMLPSLGEYGATSTGGDGGQRARTLVRTTAGGAAIGVVDGRCVRDRAQARAKTEDGSQDAQHILTGTFC